MITLNNTAQELGRKFRGIDQAMTQRLQLPTRVISALHAFKEQAGTGNAQQDPATLRTIDLIALVSVVCAGAMQNGVQPAFARRRIHFTRQNLMHHLDCSATELDEAMRIATTGRYLTVTAKKGDPEHLRFYLLMPKAKKFIRTAMQFQLRPPTEM